MKHKVIKITEEYISLDKFLKLSGEVITGGQAKVRIQSGEIMLNGKVCTMRGKKLKNRDIISIGDSVYEVEEIRP